MIFMNLYTFKPKLVFEVIIILGNAQKENMW